jgi:hypothetical protein
MYKAVFLNVLTLLLAVSMKSDVVLTGTVSDCFMQERITASGVKVAAFQLSTARGLFGMLQTLDTLTISDSDNTSFGTYSTNFDQMLATDTTSTALARASSSTTGAVTLTIPQVDSVLLVGYAFVEHDPFYYGYILTPGDAAGSFTIDMAHGHCGP